MDLVVVGRPGLLDVMIRKTSRPQNISDVHFSDNLLFYEEF